MALAWRRLGHGVIAVPMDGLPDAILAPEDQGGSDHRLARFRPARDLHPSGHYPFIEEPDAFWVAVRDFFAAV